MRTFRKTLVNQAAYRRSRHRQTPQAQGWFKRHDTSIKAVLAIIGLLFTLNEYLQRQHDARIQRSLDIYERYQTKDVLKARLVLDGAWNTPEVWQQLIARHDANGNLSYKALTDLSLQVSKDREVVDALFTVWATTAEASLCLIRGQCDQATICQTFTHDSQKYYGFFNPYFQRRNIAWDETTQNREGTTMRILNAHCGDDRYVQLYDKVEKRSGVKGAWDAVRRWCYESFNILLARPAKDG